MKDLIVLLRVMYLFSHNAHHLMARVPFLQDHEFFGEIYGTMVSDYDSVVERTIGLQGDQETGLDTIMAAASKELAGAPLFGVKENGVFFKYQLGLEVRLCEMVNNLYAKSSPGTQQMLGDIADRSEVRQYKIKRRIGY